MFTITKTDLLLVDPILAAQIKLKINTTLKFKCIKSNYWIIVENINDDFYVSATNGFVKTDSIKCSSQTKEKLINLKNNVISYV